MTENYYDAAVLEVNNDTYLVHGYNTESDLTVTRPLDSLYDFELAELKYRLEEDF